MLLIEYQLQKFSPISLQDNGGYESPYHVINQHEIETRLTFVKSMYENTPEKFLKIVKILRLDKIQNWETLFIALSRKNPHWGKDTFVKFMEINHEIITMFTNLSNQILIYETPVVQTLPNTIFLFFFFLF